MDLGTRDLGTRDLGEGGVLLGGSDSSAWLSVDPRSASPRGAAPTAHTGYPCCRPPSPLTELDPAAAQQLLTGTQPGGVPPALTLARVAAAENQAYLADAAQLPGEGGKGAGEGHLANETAPGPMGEHQRRDDAACRAPGAGWGTVARAASWRVLWWALALLVTVCSWWLAALQPDNWRS